MHELVCALSQHSKKLKKLLTVKVGFEIDVEDADSDAEELLSASSARTTAAAMSAVAACAKRIVAGTACCLACRAKDLDWVVELQEEKSRRRGAQLWSFMYGKKRPRYRNHPSSSWA